MEKHISFLDYNKIDEYVKTSIDVIDAILNDIGDIDYSNGLTIKEIITKRDGTKWFDEYWFFKYSGGIQYACTNKYDLDFEYNSTFFSLIGLYIHALSDCEFFYQKLPYTIITSKVSFRMIEEFSNDIDDHIFNYSVSIDAIKHYIMQDIPKVRKRCDFEYGLTHNKDAYNRLFLTYYILDYLIDDIKLNNWDDCFPYSENRELLRKSLSLYIFKKKELLIKEIEKLGE